MVVTLACVSTLVLQVVEDLRKCLLTFGPDELKAFFSLMNPDVGLDLSACKSLQLKGIFRLVESDVTHNLDGLAYINSPITTAAAMVRDLLPCLEWLNSPS